MRRGEPAAHTFVGGGIGVGERKLVRRSTGLTGGVRPSAAHGDWVSGGARDNLVKYGRTDFAFWRSYFFLGESTVPTWAVARWASCLVLVSTTTRE